MARDEISAGISRHEINISDVIVCELDKIFFGLKQNLYIIKYAYVKPANTSNKTHNTTGRETLDEIDALINDLSSKGDIPNSVW